MATLMRKAREEKEDCHISTVSDRQERELLELRKEFSNVIRDEPGKTDVVNHGIITVLPLFF